MKLFVAFLFGFINFSIILFASPIPMTGQLVDINQKPVAYASIGILNTPVGTVADEQGNFTLYITDKVSSTDTVRISLIGYYTLNVTVAELKEKLTAAPCLVLQEEVRKLAEVRIDASNSKVKQKGSTRIWAATYTNFALSELHRQNLGAEIGRRFNVSKGVNRLEKYQFYILSNFDTVTLRVNTYRAKDMRNLLTQNIYVTLNGPVGKWIEIDLLPYQLVVSDDIIISVQWIDSKGKGTGLQMPMQMPAMATHYYRYGSQDRWKKFRGMTTPMNLTFTRGRS